MFVLARRQNVSQNRKAQNSGPNPEFLMAPLRNQSEEEIYLDLIDELSPGVIKIAGPFLYVLMPVRLS
jgi:DNA polymerase III subunit beta